MAKRFGRNQKRKMREQIAISERRAKQARESLAHHLDIVETAKKTIAMIGRINPDFPALKRAREVCGDYYRRDIPTPVIANVKFDEDPYSPWDRDASLLHINLHQLEADIVSDEPFHRTVTVRTKLGPVDWCYSMSMEAIEYESPERICKMLGERLQKSFVELKRNGGVN